ncbi:hypothetical protein Taro_052394, partial [Colocasia esculenta]|nr:hypothetical protein [Colocasia esculenta]
TRASGGSRFGVLSVPWSHSWVPARDGTGVCSFPTWRCVRGLGWFYLWALDLVEFLLLWPVRGCCYCAACVASVVARRVRTVAARLALDSLAVVFLMWRTLASQSSSVEVLPEFFSVGSGESEFFQNGALVVLVEVLPELACVASAVLLAVVFSLMVRIVWIVHSGEGSSQDRPLSLLAEVLPRSALCSFRATVVLPRDSKCVVWLGCVLVRFSPELLRVVLVVIALSLCGDELSLLPVGLSLLQSAWALSVKVLCPWPCVWLPHGGLVSAVDVWRAVLLMEASVLRVSVALLCTGFLVGLLMQALFRFVIEVVLLALAHQGVAAVFTPYMAESVLRASCGESFMLDVVLLWPLVHLGCTLFTFGVCAPDACDSTLCCAVCLFVCFVCCFMSLLGVGGFAFSASRTRSPIGGTPDFGRDLCPVWKPMAASSVGLSCDSEVYRLASTRSCGLPALGGVWLWLDLKRLPCFHHEEETMYSIRFRWRQSALLTGVSRATTDNCALCRVLLVTEWVAGRWVTIVRSVGDCNCEDFGWHFLLFGPDLASLSTWGCRSVWAPYVCLE